MPTRQTNTPAGFTIVELLIAISVFFLVLGGLFQLLGPSNVMYSAGHRKLDVQQGARVAMDMMVRQLRMAGYFPENFDANTGNDVAVADRNPVQVGADMGLAIFGAATGCLDANADAVCDANQTALGPRSQVFLFCLDGTNLVIKVGALGAAGSYTCAVTNVEQQVVASNVTALTFAYFDGTNHRASGPARRPGAGHGPRVWRHDAAGGRPNRRHHADGPGKRAGAGAGGLHPAVERPATKSVSEGRTHAHLWLRVSDERGTVLVLALFFMAFLMVAGAFLLKMSGAETDIAYNTVWGEAAFFAAEAGLSVTVDQIGPGSVTTITIPPTAIGGSYTYAGNAQFLGTTTQPGYAIASGTAYNPAGYIFYQHVLNGIGTSTGTRMAQRQVQAQSIFGPLSQ